MTATPTSHRLLAADALTGITTHVATHLPAGSLLLVSDDTTWNVAGKRILEALEAERPIETYSLGKQAMPVLATARAMAEMAARHAGVLAVGSGTINDLCKYAAAEAGKPYLSIATAATMNGYSAANASLSEQGLKRSYPARPPIAVIADLSLIAAAPRRLTRCGLADTLCRTTVEADMLLAHHLLGTPYPRETFEQFRRHEPALIAGAPERDYSLPFIEALMHALLDGGDAMTLHGTSAPASQSEHMIAHTLEMLYGREFSRLMHGEMIALTSVTMNQLQHKLLLREVKVKALPRDITPFERQFGKARAPELLAVYQRKVLSAEEAAAINARLPSLWPALKATLHEVMMTATMLERALVQSGFSIQPEQCGIDTERYRNACVMAYLTRDRFTFLDLAIMNDWRG